MKELADTDDEVLDIGKVIKGLSDIVIATDLHSNEGRFFSGIPPSHKSKANCMFKLLRTSESLKCYIVTKKCI